MITWTAKAEKDFREKWPGRTCERIAGHQATFQGQPIKTAGHPAYKAYAMRGWLKSGGRVVKERNPEDVEWKKVSSLTLSEAEKCQRWETMRAWIQSAPHIPLNILAIKTGLGSGTALRQFCEKYGAELAGKYGKLPRLESIKYKTGNWQSIME